MNIELRHLRYFVAVAEEASFTGAAHRVHVAQQVLSTQIRQLEAAVGTQLLRRTSRGVLLTPAGTAFLDAARSTLAGLERGACAAPVGLQLVGQNPGFDGRSGPRRRRAPARRGRPPPMAPPAIAPADLNPATRDITSRATTTPTSSSPSSR